MTIAANPVPKVSVVLPVYNAEASLQEALDSILGQSYGDFELIIIDDGSTDSSHAVLSQLTDTRVRIINNSSNMGLVTTLNRGLSLCRGMFIARMDADDICEQDRFEKQVRFLHHHPEVDIVGGAIHFFGNIHKPYTHVFPHDHDDIHVAMLFYCPLAHPALMFRRSLIERKLLNYSEDFRHAEDYHLWSQLLPHVRSANLPDRLLNYRLHSSQVSSGQSNRQYNASVQVRKFMLTAAQIDWDQSDIDTHESIVRERFLSTSEYLNRVAVWFEKIETANTASKYWNPIALHRLLSDKFCTIMLRSGNQGPGSNLSPISMRYLADGGYKPVFLLTSWYRKAKLLVRNIISFCRHQIKGS